MNYKPGKEIKVADTLSRAHLQDSRTEIPDMELDFVVHSVISSLPISPKGLNDFTQETTMMFYRSLRQDLFDLRAGNSNLAKSLTEKSNHAMYQDENPHRCLLSLQN